MNQTTLLLTRTVLSAATQMADSSDSNFSTVTPFLFIILGIGGLCLILTLKHAITPINYDDNSFNSIPLANREQVVNTYINVGTPLHVNNVETHSDIDEVDITSIVSLPQDSRANLIDIEAQIEAAGNVDFSESESPISPTDNVRPDSTTIPARGFEESDIGEAFEYFI
uniref:hypothetical protein n=1 Tax=Fuscoporia viticola TaxID=139386 RepID=UPI0023AAC716|nr:hypothetical protein P1Q19_mgp16 [Fuscoporia viticola]WCF76843.1 hypothetical protein [Fuscoporia viticola]